MHSSTEKTMNHRRNRKPDYQAETGSGHRVTPQSASRFPANPACKLE